MENYGGLCWLSNLAGNRPSMKYLYQPDVDRIIKSYYTVQVIIMYAYFNEDTGRFSKLDLSKGWVSDLKRDVLNICYMYCLDVFYKMFSEMMKEYYRTFSWEKITSENIQQRYDQMANELKVIIEEQKNQIASLDRRISLLQSKPSKNDDRKDKAAIEYERQNAKLIKEIEQKDNEIVRLKDYIRSQEEFLALQGRTESDDAGAVDTDSLKSRKYLFVGRINEALPNLRREFPNSVFMQSETTDISDIATDAIVFFPKLMSHSMFYKVKNYAIYQKVPSAMCNSKNIDRIYSEMSRQLKFD